MGAIDRADAFFRDRGTATCDMDIRYGGTKQFESASRCKPIATMFVLGIDAMNVVFETGPDSVSAVAADIGQGIRKHTIQGTLLSVGDIKA